MQSFEVGPRRLDVGAVTEGRKGGERGALRMPRSVKLSANRPLRSTAAAISRCATWSRASRPKAAANGEPANHRTSSANARCASG